MHGLGTLIRLGIALLTFGPFAARAEAEPVVLRAGDLTASFAAADGRLRSLAVGPHELLVSPGELTLQVDKAAPIALGANLEGFSLTQRGGGLIVEGREPSSGVTVRAEWLAGADLECRITLTGAKKPRCEAAAELRLPFAGRPLEVLAPGPEDQQKTDFSRFVRVHGYRGKGCTLAMPAVVVYRPDDGLGPDGFRRFRPADVRVRGLGCETRRRP